MSSDPPHPPGSTRHCVQCGAVYPAREPHTCAPARPPGVAAALTDTAALAETPEAPLQAVGGTAPTLPPRRASVRPDAALVPVSVLTTADALLQTHQAPPRAPEGGSDATPPGPVDPAAAGLDAEIGAGRAAAAATRALGGSSLVGTILNGRYEITSRIGKGAMGVVYKARHLVLDSQVAIKVLLKPQNTEDQRRFLLEARLASRVAHPNTVYVSDFGVLPDGRSYLVMEFLRGETLGSFMSQGPLDPLRVCRIAAQIARGLQAIHDKGIVHRGL